MDDLGDKNNSSLIKQALRSKFLITVKGWYWQALYEPIHFDSFKLDFLITFAVNLYLMILIVNLYNVFVYCVLLYYAVKLYFLLIFPLIMVAKLYVVLVYCCTILCTGVLYMLGLSCIMHV